MNENKEKEKEKQLKIQFNYLFFLVPFILFIMLFLLTFSYLILLRHQPTLQPIDIRGWNVEAVDMEKVRKGRRQENTKGQERERRSK